MALAPSGLLTAGKYAYTSTQSQYADIFFLIGYTENETDPSAYYQIETKIGGVYSVVGFVSKGQGRAQVRIGYISVGNFLFVPQVTDVRITCFLNPTDGSPGAAAYTIPAQSYQHVAPANFAINRSYHGSAQQPGATELTFVWSDASEFLIAGYWEIVKATNNAIASTAGTSIYITDPGDQSSGFGIMLGRGFSASMIEQLPPQSGYTPPAAAVKDGDLLQVKITTNTVLQSGHTNIPLTSVFSYVYYRLYAATAGQSFNGNVGQAFSKQVTYTPNDSLVITAPLFSASGLPGGLSISSSGLITGTPTTAGNYTVNITTTNPTGNGVTQTLVIVINPSAVPVITAPASPVALTTLTPASVQLIASNNPTSFAVSSGTLPAGTSLNTSTGLITGTPTTVASPVVVFTAANTAGTSATYSITFTVTALAVPSITSAGTLTAYVGEPVSYTITSTPDATSWNATPLPSGLIRSGPTISGIITMAMVDGIRLDATNAAGTGTKNLVLTVLVRPPVITSPLTASGALGVPFSYQIGATNAPTSYGATNLPPGLTVNTSTGVISGTPSSGGSTSVTITAANAGGSVSATLVLTIVLPQKPLIDTSITGGKTITALTGVTFAFQPTASNNPTKWTADPIPANMALIPSTGEIIGQFAIPGLYGMIMTAANIGGTSDPATFFFLVESGSAGVVAAAASYGVDIWIDIQDGSVSLLPPDDGTTPPATGAAPATTTIAVLKVKRGDTLPTTIRFHKGGIPVNIVPSTLKFAIREDFDQPFVILATDFAAIPNSIGAFAIYPNFSANNQLNFDLDGPGARTSVDFLTEVQWETAAPDPVSRRSSDTFTTTVGKDVINPD